MSTTALHEAPTGKDEDLADGTASGNDPEAGKIFDIPRVKIVIDESDPTVLKLAFKGDIEIDRNDATFFNDLPEGRNVELRVTAFVAGSKKTHRRDSDGDVDAVVQTKSLLIHSITVDES